MTDRAKHLVIGISTAAVILGFAAWFDATVMAGASRELSETFDGTTQWGLALGLGSMLVAGLVLAIVGIGWRCRSVGLGIVYVLVGGLFTFLLYLTLAVGAAITSPNGSAPLEGVLSVLSNLNGSVFGPLNAVGIVGGAMVIVGVAQIVMGIVRRPAGHRAPAQAAEPIEPRATIEEVVGPDGGSGPQETSSTTPW